MRRCSFSARWNGSFVTWNSPTLTKMILLYYCGAHRVIGRRTSAEPWPGRPAGSVDAPPKQFGRQLKKFTFLRTKWSVVSTYSSRGPEGRLRPSGYPTKTGNCQKPYRRCVGYLGCVIISVNMWITTRNTQLPSYLNAAKKVGHGMILLGALRHSSV